MSSAPASNSGPDFSIVVPVYANEANIPGLLERLSDLHVRIPGGIRAVLVVDGSPDRSAELLTAGLPNMPFESRLLLLSRNFGSFAAIRAGLAETDTSMIAVMSADLQEPAELYRQFFDAFARDRADVLLGTRTDRSDPWAGRMAARLFWGAYRRLVQPELPIGGVDVFACNRAFRDHLLRLHEANSSLVGQLLWLGFRRAEIPYARQPRQFGRSAWTLTRKLRYLSDSVYSFSDLPIRTLLITGGGGLLLCALFAAVVLVARLSGVIEVPGYAATVLIVLFFAGINLLGLGIIGAYVWRAYENTKSRPLSVVMVRRDFLNPESR